MTNLFQEIKWLLLNGTIHRHHAQNPVKLLENPVELLENPVDLLENPADLLENPVEGY